VLVIFAILLTIMMNFYAGGEGGPHRSTAPLNQKNDAIASSFDGSITPARGNPSVISQFPPGNDHNAGAKQN
jgi:hypothetical protein